MTNPAPVRRLGSFTLQSWEARTMKPLLIAAVAFLVVLTVPVIDVHLSPASIVLIRVLDVGIWFAFAVDYAVRLWLAPARWPFIKRNVPDLAMVALPALRPLRILRLLSLGTRVARSSANTALADTTRAVAASAVLLVYLGAVGVLDSERNAPHANIHTFGEAIWWSSSTITSVGYGDRYPVTTPGRLVAVGLMVIGIALLGLLTAGIAAWFVRQSTDLALQQETAAVVAEVQSLGAEELQAQRRIDDELGEVLEAMAALDRRLRDIQRRAASQ
jgi:voltage-gated potassium channel